MKGHFNGLLVVSTSHHKQPDFKKTQTMVLIKNKEFRPSQTLKCAISPPAQCDEVHAPNRPAIILVFRNVQRAERLLLRRPRKKVCSYQRNTN